MSTPDSFAALPEPDVVYRARSGIGQKRPRSSDSSAIESPVPRRTKSVGADPKGNNRQLLAKSSFSNGSSNGKDDSWKGDMFRKFVRKALVDMENGDSTTYDDLLSQLRPVITRRSQFPDPDGEPLLKTSLIHPLLVALTSNASLLSSTHKSLIEAIIHFPWMTANDTFVKSYIILVGVIANLRMEYVGELVKRCIKGFKYQAQFRNLVDRETESNNLTRGKVFERLHTLLTHLISLIPTLPGVIQPILVKSFPHKREPKIAHLTYIRNALRVVEYCPVLGDRILAAVVDRAIQIDVEIQVEWDDMDEDADGEEGNEDGQSDAESDTDPFDRLLADEVDDEEPSDDEDSDFGGGDSSDESDDEAPPVTENLSLEAKRERVKVIKEMVSKLDVILNTTFEHFNKLQKATDPNYWVQTSASNSLSGVDPVIGTLVDPALALGLQTSVPTPTGTNPFDRITSFPFPPTPAASRPSSPSEIERNRTLRLSQFHSLLSIFDGHILKTFKSRYTQFLLFWYTSLDADFTDEFQGLLVSKALFEKDQPDVIRKAAASYIGSFVSRAKWVDGVSVRNVVKLLCQYLEAQMETAKLYPELLYGTSSSSGVGGGGSSQKGSIGGVNGQGGLGVFYAVAQSVFLIFCFRWKDLVGEGDEPPRPDEEDVLDMEGDLGEERRTTGWAPGLDVLQKVVSSPFNPLKVCSPNVVKQFALVANQTRFLYVYHIIQANNRSSSSASVDVSLPSPSVEQAQFLSAGKANVPIPHLRDWQHSTMEEADLDSFFPFDPYNLPIKDEDGDISIPDAVESSESDSEDERTRRELGSSIPESKDKVSRLTSKSIEGRRPIKFGSGGLSVSADDQEINLLGKSFDGGMSISPAFANGLAGRMQQHQEARS
ncbi:RNA polymerase I transcription factor [Phaffia rhodozyma]|uniref:RNA polymerase I transcription factor n=1 Tax=Phaffia rhodozyma TaxID=264483 RepID=A0A0F7SSN4_PHARH|nr:RNA polymerase I transcription factor [Phaffia rhodozyma]